MSSLERQMRRRAEKERRKAASQPSGNRERRRRVTQAKGDGSRLLYHGTTAELADLIRGEGLRPGLDGRVYLTDSFAMAQRYAQWSAAMAATVTTSGAGAKSDVGEQAQQLGGPVAVVMHVRVPAGVEVLPEHASMAPPLPWETIMCDGNAFYIEQSIDSDRIGPYEMHRVDELDEPGMIDVVAEEADVIAGAFRRDNASPGSAAPSASGSFTEALPSPLEFLGAVIDASPNARSPRHGVGHWLGVGAAGARLLEAGCPADPAVLFAFAVLHDSQRDSEGPDTAHGQRAAALARQLAGKHLRFTEVQLDLLCDAMVRHHDRQASDDPTIGACWDADRLARFLPDPSRLRRELLSTAQALELLADNLERVPPPEACDWTWTVFRYHLAYGRPAVHFEDRPTSPVPSSPEAADGDPTEQLDAFARAVLRDGDDDRAIEWARDLGLEVVGRGFSRIVLAAGDGLVAKVPWRDLGWLGNLTEAALWSHVDEETRSLLCPCVSLSPAGVLLMQRAIPLLGPLADLADRDAGELEHTDTLRGPREAVLSLGVHDDLGVHQWGRVDGRLVLLDYGRVAPPCDARLDESRKALRARLARGELAGLDKLAEAADTIAEAA